MLKPLSDQDCLKNPNYYKDLWTQILAEMRGVYGDSAFENWLSKISISHYVNQTVYLAVPSNFMRDWINSHYIEKIKGLWQYLDKSIVNVEVLIAKPQAIKGSSNIITNTSPEPGNDYLKSSIDQRFTFSNFVVGSSNEMAYAASRAVAESKNAVAEYNPLFLYGGVGLGKTHLMHAIANHISDSQPHKKVVYMSAEKFMYRFVQAIRNKNIATFKDCFGSANVLMIDDIQFICGKESTQEEFFHIFNHLIGRSQIVISCDKAPSDLDDIEDRVKSRLGWGLVVDIHRTTYELRIGILQSKIEQMGINVPQDVVEFLATKVVSNVRELEGALNKVVAYASIAKSPVSLDLARNILKDLIKSSDKVVTIGDIQKHIAHKYNIKITDLTAADRSKNLVRLRQLGMYVAKQITSCSLGDIGKSFGKRDHTTVIHALKKVEELLRNGELMQSEIDEVIRGLQM